MTKKKPDTKYDALWTNVINLLKQKAYEPYDEPVELSVAFIREVITLIECIEIDNECISNDLKKANEKIAELQWRREPHHD